MYLPTKWLLMLSLLLGGHVLAQDVRMGFGLRIAPYAFSDSDRGVEVDIAREALAYRGHVMIANYFPLERLPLAFRYARVDATMMDLGEDLSKDGGHYAEPAVFYDNVLISLANKKIEFNHPQALADKVVIGYTGAAQRYDSWIAPAAKDGLYFETNDQELQVLGIYRGHFDVMVTDRYIFNYFSQKLARERGLKLAPVNEYRFTTIEEDKHRPVFRDPKIRDDFNAGVAHLKETGRFQEIYNAYLTSSLPSPKKPFLTQSK